MSSDSAVSKNVPFTTRIVEYFLKGPFPIIMIVISLILGAVALFLTPREEDPQIVVPMADLFIEAPGLSAHEVERQITSRVEKLLYQIDGIEYVYSMSKPNRAIITARFYVGEDREDSIVKLYNKLHSNLDIVPDSVQSWVLKPVEIDDVPIVIATIWSDDQERYGPAELRRFAEEVEIKLQSVKDTNRIQIVGGLPREVRIEFNPSAMTAHQTTLKDLQFALNVSNVETRAGDLLQNNETIIVDSGRFFDKVDSLQKLVVNVVDGEPVYLKDVAAIIDTSVEADNYTWISYGASHKSRNTFPDYYPAVQIAIAKKKGSNAVWVADHVIERIDQLSKELLPEGIHYEITRNYGETADHKVNELVEALVVAVITVIVFLGWFLGWRTALIIALAIPICYSITLFINMSLGYTINRVTLFALILSLGLLVDDPITDVENIERYLRKGKYGLTESILRAIQEVRPALILSTLAIILSFLPLKFITGMMGPYMAPMALNVPLTVTVSTIVAFCITPFLSRVFLKNASIPQEEDNPALFRLYKTILSPLLSSRRNSLLFLGAILICFLGAIILPSFRLVPLKMLPFDNKPEFQIVVDMPEGTSLESTNACLLEIADSVRMANEVEEVVLTAGTSSPMDFNGMVRHYFLRRGHHLGDIRVNLVDKGHRQQQSHEILLRLREDVQQIAERHGAVTKMIEVPPGPPVLATIVGEIYGQPYHTYKELQTQALSVAERLGREPFVVDVDTSVEAEQKRLIFEVDKEKAALSGLSTADINQALQIAVSGSQIGTLHIPSEVNPLPIRLQLPLDKRKSKNDLSQISLHGMLGVAKQREGNNILDAPVPVVSIGELGTFISQPSQQTIYHKNLERVVYVEGEVAGRSPADAILDIAFDRNISTSQPRPLTQRSYLKNGGGDPWQLSDGITVKWNGEGELKITLDVFRDLGLAFGAAMVGIFILLLVQTRSSVLSLIIMTAIPLSMIGIMPGFWFLNHFFTAPVNSLPNPVYFTATAMIGMIALSGIVVRNSVVLIDFVHQALRNGSDLKDALIQAGAIRTRPIVLTAGTTFLGNIVITFDPIFSGLAWSIIFGIFASTFFTLGVIPVIYHLVYSSQPGHGIAPMESQQ